jgi:hypothetical protein
VLVRDPDNHSKQHKSDKANKEEPSFHAHDDG